VSRLNRFVLGSLLAASIVAPSLWAAEAASEDDSEGEHSGNSGDLVEYVEVTDSSLPTSNTIATKLNIPLQLTPANVGTVGDRLIYEQDAAYLGDALRNVSGLNIQDGSGVHEYFAIRGFDSVSSGLVMTDGAGEPEVTYYQMYNVRGVEVFKGPGGFLYGKNPLAGVVNIVRKQPLEGNFASFNGSSGSFGTHEGMLDWNRSTRDGGVNFRLNGLWQESDHYRDDMASEHVGVNPSLTLKIGDRSKLNFNFEHVDADYSPDNGIPLVNNDIPGVSRRRSYQASGDFSEQTLDRLQVDFETELSDSVRLRNKTYYKSLDWQSEGALLGMTFPNVVAPGQVEVMRDLAVLNDKQEFFGNQLEAIFELNGGSVQHNLLLGLEIVQESDEYTFDIEPLVDIELFSLQERDVIPGLPGPLNSLGDVTNTVIAPYVIDQMKLSSMVELFLGVRYDDIDVDGDVRPLGFPTPLPFSRDDSEASPMAGIVVAPDSSLSFYANAAQSYAPPSTRLVNEIDPASREPERGRQIETGVKKRFMDGKVRTGLAVYELERDRIAIAGADGFTQQSGDQRSRGVEIEVAAEPRPQLRTFFSYAYNDAELTDFTPCVVVDPNLPCEEQLFTGNTPIMAPEHLANLWISKSFGNGFGVSGGARYVDEQFISEDNLFAIDSSLVLDAAVFYDAEVWRFKVNFKNITDEEYETRGIAGATSVIPANPFAAYASIEFRVR
jgi:catecholate siderophore receptor